MTRQPSAGGQTQSFAIVEEQNHACQLPLGTPISHRPFGDVHRSLQHALKVERRPQRAGQLLQAIRPLDARAQIINLAARRAQLESEPLSQRELSDVAGQKRDPHDDSGGQDGRHQNHGRQPLPVFPQEQRRAHQAGHYADEQTRHPMETDGGSDDGKQCQQEKRVKDQLGWAGRGAQIIVPARSQSQIEQNRADRQCACHPPGIGQQSDARIIGQRRARQRRHSRGDPDQQRRLGLDQPEKEIDDTCPQIDQPAQAGNLQVNPGGALFPFHLEHCRCRLWLPVPHRSSRPARRAAQRPLLQVILMESERAHKTSPVL